MKAWRDLAKLPRELWILCLSTFVNRLGTMALPFLTLYVTRSLGLPATRAGVALAVYGAVAMVAGPVGGRLADRWGPLRVIEGTLLSSGIVLLLFPLVRSWGLVLLMTALFAATNEAFRPANLSLIGELAAPESRKQAFVLNRLAVNLGMSVGPLVGGFLARQSYAFIFLADGLTALAAAGILLLSSFHRVAKRREEHMPTASAAGPAAPRQSLLATLATDRLVRVFLIGIFPALIVFCQHESTLPLFLVRDLGFSESSYGTLFTINTGLIILFEVPLNAATADWPPGRTLAMGSVLLAAGFGALALTHTYIEVALTVAVWTFGEMILLPGMSAYVADIAPAGQRGTYMGWYMMTFSAAFMAGPWLGTELLQRRGGVTLWVVMAALALIGAAVLGRTRPRART